MGRLLFYLIIACVVLRMATGRWPWQLLAGNADSREVEAARSLLGLRPARVRLLNDGVLRLPVGVCLDGGLQRLLVGVGVHRLGHRHHAIVAVAAGVRGQDVLADRPGRLTRVGATD